MVDSNRTVLITGAAQGLGRAMGIGLLERGFSVAAVDCDANGLSALSEQVGAGQKLKGFVADLTDFDAGLPGLLTITPPPRDVPPAARAGPRRGSWLRRSRGRRVHGDT